ncbi:MAG: nucleoside deaminase [Bacteroidota bacterium]|nr:nucleoside deaminase [Bacteroidota bacterium]
MVEMFDDHYFMKQALIEAQKAYDADEVPVGAVVVIDNKIIARAHNLTVRLNDVTAHAEMQAITAAANFLNGKYLIDCTLYVTLEPCVMCMGAIYWSQLSKIVFGAEDKKRGYQQACLDPHPKAFVYGGVMAKEATVLIQRFFQKKRK